MHLHGKRLLHPFTGDTLPIILDTKLVDMALGTGAVKITPAHDANDFEVGVRHGLPSVTVIDQHGMMTSECGDEFAGLARFEAREAVMEKLDQLGLHRGDIDHPMVVPVCSRSGDVIEPRLCAQWYLDCKTMAGRAVDAVDDGQLELVPARFGKTWRHGARFSIEIYTRGCHWFPRLLA
jgi:valyl-tRNA synthetase